MLCKFEKGVFDRVNDFETILVSGIVGRDTNVRDIRKPLLKYVEIKHELAIEKYMPYYF